jgi:hypothetical protein
MSQVLGATRSSAVGARVHDVSVDRTTGPPRRPAAPAPGPRRPVVRGCGVPDGRDVGRRRGMGSSARRLPSTPAASPPACTARPSRWGRRPPRRRRAADRRRSTALAVLVVGAVGIAVAGAAALLPGAAGPPRRAALSSEPRRRECRSSEEASASQPSLNRSRAHSTAMSELASESVSQCPRRRGSLRPSPSTPRPDVPSERSEGVR